MSHACSMSGALRGGKPRHLQEGSWTLAFARVTERGGKIGEFPLIRLSGESHDPLMNSNMQNCLLRGHRGSRLSPGWRLKGRMTAEGGD